MNDEDPGCTTTTTTTSSSRDRSFNHKMSVGTTPLVSDWVEDYVHSLSKEVLKRIDTPGELLCF